MKRTAMIGLLVLLLAGLGFTGCTGSLKGGASIKLSGVNLGAVDLDGRPVSGLPSAKVNILLDVSAQRIDIKYAPDGSVITLIPSGATIELKQSGVIIKGIKSEQTKLEWVVPTPAS